MSGRKPSREEVEDWLCKYGIQQIFLEGRCELPKSMFGERSSTGKSSSATGPGAPNNDAKKSDEDKPTSVESCN